MASINNKRIERVIKLDSSVFKEIKEDKDAMSEAVVAMMVASIVGFVWYILLTLGIGLIVIIFAVPIGWVISTGIYHIIAKLFGGKGTFEDYLKLSAYSRVPLILGVVPLLGTIIGGIIAFIAFVFATRETHGFSTGKALIVVLIPTIVLMLLVFLLFGAAFLFGLAGSN